MKENLNQFPDRLKLGESTLYVIPDFPEIDKEAFYEAMYQRTAPSLVFTSGSWTPAQAKDTYCLTLDFPASPFTFNRIGYLKLFLYPDHSLLGKAHYDKGSRLQDEHLKGFWFLSDGYVYLEMTWTAVNNQSWKVWAWADLEGGQDTLGMTLQKIINPKS